ncbi:MAG: biopolymer transporter ExbD [Chloroflexia bacterium]|nr:biopolymer transporter ExbD [Chloroflexia bacterium]
MKRLLLLFFLSNILISAIPQTNCKEINIFIILINTYDQLFVEHEVMNIKDLKDAVKEYITNPREDYNLSEKREEDIPLLGKMLVSKGLISIQCDRNTNYQAYINVQNEVERAFNELRNELALEKFNTPYKKLSKEKRRAINKAIPKRISEAEPRRVRN